MDAAFGRYAESEKAWKKFHVPLLSGKEFSFAKLSFFENESPDDLRLDENANYIKLNIGATIGAHTGPTAIGIAYIRNYNDDFVDKLVVKEEKQAIKENKKIEKLEKKIEKLESKKRKFDK